LQAVNQPLYPANAAYAGAHSAGSSIVRFAPGTAWPESGCVVTSVATVAKISYEEAREVAQKVAGFDGSAGMTFTKAKKVLGELGFLSTRIEQGNDWSKFPNLAIVTVHGKRGALHAVVFSRENGQERVIDNGHVGKPSDYQLVNGDEYLAVHGRNSHRRRLRS
jgi:hypothetical protein